MSQRDDGVLVALRQGIRSRLKYFAVLTGLAGLALLLLGRASATSDSWASSLASVPLEAIGGSLVGSAVVLVAFEIYVRQQTEAISKLELSSMLDQYERRAINAILEAVRVGDRKSVQTFAESLSHDQVGELAANALEMLVADRGLARSTIASAVDRARATDERWSDLKIGMTLRPAPGDEQDHFDLHIVADFTVSKLSSVIEATCVVDRVDYLEKLKSARYLWCWYHEPTSAYPQARENVFQVESVTIDGRPVSVHSVISGDSITFSAVPADHLAQQLLHGAEPRVRIALRKRVQRRGHCVYFDVPRVCHTVRYEFDYAGCRIRHLNVIDAFGSTSAPIVTRMAGAPERVSIEVHDWVNPKAGVVFVWVLEEEFPPLNSPDVIREHHLG